MSSPDVQYRQPDSTYYPIAIVSFIGWMVLYKYISPKLSGICLPAYKLLPAGKKVEWNTRIVSDVHSVLVSILSFYCLLFEDSISKDPLWANSTLVKTACSIVIGYMLCDFVVMILNYGAIGEVFYLFHHLASIYAYYFVITYSSLCWFANFRMMAEFSTPFVNQRWFLDVLGYPRSSPLFVLNGIAMSVMFFVVRILSIPPYWYKVFTFYGTEGAASLGNIWLMNLILSIPMDCLNIHWFTKMVKGAIKVLKKRDDKQS